MMKRKRNFPKTIALGLILFLFFSSAWQCQPTKNINGGDCNELATVQDFTGLDGCSLMIVTEKGEKLLPGAIDDTNFVLEAGQKISLSYWKMSDQMSICMAEDKIVRITCIQLVQDDSRAAIPPCDKVDEIGKESWLTPLIANHRPKEIIRYQYKPDGWAYLFTGKEFYLYDCQGTLIKKETTAEACLAGEVTILDSGKVIFRSEGMKG